MEDASIVVPVGEDEDEEGGLVIVMGKGRVKSG